MPITFRNSSHNDFEKRVKKHIKYEKMGSLIGFFLFVCALIPPLLVSFVAYLIQIELNPIWQFPPMGVGFLIWYVLLKSLNRKLREYSVDSDEWARFYTRSIHTNLEKYSKTRSLGMKKGYRKKALKAAKDFLSCIEGRWTIGDFKALEAYVGNSLFDLKKNLRYRVIPAIKDGDDELLRKVSQIMFSFQFFSKKLSIEKINKLNQQMSEKEGRRLPNQEPLKVGHFTRFTRTLQTHKSLKHCVTVSGFAVISIVLGYIGINYGLAKEYAWMGAITLFIGLTGIYFAGQPKTEK